MTAPDTGGFVVDGPDVSVTECPGGPLLVRGAVGIRDADGRMHENPRRTVALCRCGKSSIRPWCDGTHKVIPRPERRARPVAAVEPV